MKKYIHLKKEDRDFLEQVFKVTSRMVYNALHYVGEGGGSDLAKKIRKIALDRGGIVMVEAPEAETLFDGDGYMRQYLNNGRVLLEFKYADNSCTVYVKGEEARRFEHVFVSDIPHIQEYAERFHAAAGLTPALSKGEVAKRRTQPAAASVSAQNGAALRAAMA